MCKSAFLKSKICLFLLCLCMLLPSAAFAEVQTYEADGYYTMGDGLEENVKIAKDRALEDARGMAAQQAGTFVRKIVSTKNHQLVESQTTMMASAVLQIQSVSYTPEPVGDVIRYRCHIVVVVDDGQVLAMMSEKKELEEALKREQQKDEHIAELNRQMEDLKRQYQTASTPEQKTEIRLKVKVNENAFTAAQLVYEGCKVFRPWDIAESVKYFKQAIEVDPQYMPAYKSLGTAYLASKEYDKAFAIYRKAFENFPDETLPDEGDLMYGNSLRRGLQLICYTAWDKAKTVEEKIAICKKAIAISPMEGAGYWRLAMTYSAHGMKAEADECRRKIIEFCQRRLDSNKYPKTTREYYKRMIEAYEGLGDYEGAVEACTDWIAYCEGTNDLTPNGKINWTAQAYTARAKCYEKLERYEDAKQDYAKAYELKPNDKKTAENWQRAENW